MPRSELGRPRLAKEIKTVRVLICMEEPLRDLLQEIADKENISIAKVIRGVVKMQYKHQYAKKVREALDAERKKKWLEGSR